AVQRIVPGSTHQDVVAGKAIESVVATLADQKVVFCRPVENLAGCGPLDHVEDAVAEPQLLDAANRVATIGNGVESSLVFAGIVVLRRLDKAAMVNEQALVTVEPERIVGTHVRIDRGVDVAGNVAIEDLADDGELARLDFSREHAWRELGHAV